MGLLHRPIDEIIANANDNHWMVSTRKSSRGGVILSHQFTPRVQGLVDYLRSEKLKDTPYGVSFVGDYTNTPVPHLAEILIYAPEHDPNGKLSFVDRAFIGLRTNFVISAWGSNRYPLLEELGRGLTGKYVDESGIVGVFTPESRDGD